MTAESFKHERQRREWEAQEHALNDERRNALNDGTSDDTSDDGGVAQYRLIARALRRPHFDPVPSNFSYQVLARIRLLDAAADEHVELWLQRCLCAVLAIAGIASITLLGGRWRTSMLSTLEWAPIERLGAGLQSDGWGVIALICIAASWALGRWRASTPN